MGMRPQAIRQTLAAIRLPDQVMEVNEN